jgi:hypothetical protein
MKPKGIKSGLVLFCGWVVILVSAAVILPRTVSKAIALPIIVLTLLWFLLSVIALVFYYYRAWRRVLVGPKDWAWIAWTSFETLFVLAAVTGLVLLFALPS